MSWQISGWFDDFGFEEQWSRVCLLFVYLKDNTYCV